MALSLLAANNAQTVLAAGISSTATSLTVNTGTGILFPSPATGTSFFKLTIIDAATGTLTEIVHVTARNGDVFTIQRGQEGTVPRAWSANDIAANMMTAGTLSYILGNFQPLDPTLTALAALVGVANKLPYFNGDDTAALTDLTQVGRDIIGKTDIAAVLQYLGLGDDARLSGNLTVKGGVWDTAPGDTPERVWSPNNKPSLTTLGVLDATTTQKGIVELATNAEMATGTSSSLVPSVAAVMSIFSKRSFSANDYVRIPDVPGGLIIQWVSGNASASGVFFAQMPIPFPNKLLFAGAVEAGANVWGTDSATTWGIDFANSSLSQVIAYARRIFPTTVTQEAAAGLVIAIGN
ncbi:hypothetical protein Q6Y84_001072 [Salmonella enterica]|nr:hypothetical protein [Salmonella enterica]ELK9835621.1 hypothetical protein [Salmonella enterica]